MAVPYPPPTGSARTLQRQYTALADTIKGALEENGPSSPKPSPIEATNKCAPTAVYQPLVAGITDPGIPGKGNQDDFFIWQSDDGQTIVMGVLDGHGRELGQVAAKVARDTFLALLTSPDGLARVSAAPKETMQAAFATAHQAIEDTFRRYYESSGWTVSKGVGRDGYLIRTKGASSVTQCVHGGTTATIVILLDGQRLIVSNVGDSTALMCGIGNAGQLRSIDDWVPMQPLRRHTDASPSPGKCSSLVTGVPPQLAKTYMEMSADHSPESASEFVRMHQFRPHASIPNRPELLFVYDTLTASKISCPPIFEVDQAGAASKTDRGSYYKNVRCEWASLVSTPPHAAFQDALAFTRSLGDLHLQVYGVSHSPATWWMDLVVPAPQSIPEGRGRSDSPDGVTPLANALQSKLALELGSGNSSGTSQSPLLSSHSSGSVGPHGSGVGAPIVAHPFAIALCSDGIWDNWRFEDVSEFVLGRDRVDRVARSGQADQAAGDLMAANLDKARVNFGSSADNMTAITLYMLPRA